MLLDIAICFHDEDLESVKRAWRVCRAFADAGWQNLLDIGLVTTTIRVGDTKIQMHEVLRDLGRSIACPDPRNIQGHSRVCYNSASEPWPFVQNSTQGNSKLEILKIFSSNMTGTTIDTRKLRGLENLKALWLEGVHLRGTWNLLPATLEFLKVKEGRIHSWLSVKRKARWLDNVVLLEESLEEQAGRIYQLGSSRHATLRHVEIESGSTLESPRDTLDQLEALEYLSFGYCSSQYVPHSCKQHRALKYLILHYYDSTTLPDSMGDVQALEHLDIWGERLESLPDSLGQLGALKSLTICADPVITIPDSLGQLSALESLTLHRCDELRVLPSTLGGLSSLKSLKLSSLNWGFTALPSTLGQLRALESLTIIYCKGLRTLPDSLGQLKALRLLDVRCCPRFIAFPETLGQLDGLRELTIFSCLVLKSLPDALGKLQALSHLVIRSCPTLKTLPSTLKELPRLQHLELEWYRNSLKALERILGQLMPLEHFTLFTSHDSRVVQETLGHLDAVKHLTIWIGRD